MCLQRLLGYVVPSVEWPHLAAVSKLVPASARPLASPPSLETVTRARWDQEASPHLRALALQSACLVAARIARAVAFMHQHGVLHGSASLASCVLYALPVL